MDLFGVAAARKGVRLESEIPAELPLLHADPNQLERALANLLSNALKFTPAGGFVILGARAAGERAELFVQDNGKGIPPDARARLFERFERGSEDGAFGSTAGTGLGLHLVRESIEGMGGTVALESEPGKGTRVTLTLDTVSIAAARRPA
jgi:signal transduction histidine kinase